MNRMFVDFSDVTEIMAVFYLDRQCLVFNYLVKDYFIFHVVQISAACMKRDGFYLHSLLHFYKLISNSECKYSEMTHRQH